MLELVCKKFHTLEYYFISEEPACCIFVTNDKEKKYFQYGKKYEYMSKDDINRCIELNRKLDKIMKNEIIPNDVIYLRISD